MIVVVYDTFCGKSGNLDGIASAEVDFVEGSAPMVLRGIYPVDLLHDLHLTVYLMKSVTILAPGLGDQLEVQQAVAAHDGIFDRNTVGQIILDRLGDHTSVVIDVERSCRGNPTNENATLDFGVALERNLDIIVHIFLTDHLDKVFLQLKAGSVLPLLRDLLIHGNIAVIKTDHDTIGVELNDLQGGAILNKMFRHFE